MPTQSNDSKPDVDGMAEFRLVLSVSGCGWIGYNVLDGPMRDE